jgi:hypothetical protein
VDLPPTLVLKSALTPRCNEEWGSAFNIGPPTIPEEIETIVFNITYTWAAQMSAANFTNALHKQDLPESVKHMVFHFKHDGRERPRIARFKIVPGSLIPGIAELYPATVIPVLAPGQWLGIMASKMGPNPSFSEQIMELYTNAIAKGKGCNRALKLTVVGLDEFDDVLKADAAGDKVLEAAIPKLPWPGAPPTLSEFAHPPCEDVAPTFIDKLMGLTHKSEHERIRCDVQVLSSAEYVASLGPRRYEEDLWVDAKDVDECDCCFGPWARGGGRSRGR